MCGRYNVTDSPEIRILMEQLGLPSITPRFQHNVPPGGTGEFVIQAADDRYLLPGIWSLLIEPRPEGHSYRPNPKFHTFNARSDRLTSSALWKKIYPSKRCIVPVSAFHEWQGKQVYNIHPQNEATALAGLWQSWHFGDEQVNSFTVITLPPHPRFSHIHAKSIPLMLRPDDFDLWLDPDFHQMDAFQSLMQTHIPAPLVCEPVHGPKDLKLTGKAELLPGD
ncbi:Putative SOS response-associated peptidase YedK [Marinobacter sp. LV10R510-11A]|uniref:SOS response-associated peptidase n=1 Tax=Marinobacter sp. LV10R510-11A TaxID=1415568 RepID=UPI000BB871F5|nr:SOS response-associated peptidase family protein [Marinobacter sp. LV10R510-11A]SOB74721.1 Putative SOS response-associated peptidase YedK [Marinobacter sp. LV10R510-11A]